jgi:hypothetical protein
VGGQEVVRPAGRQRREDRQPERAADLLGSVEQRGREPGLVGGHAGVGGRRRGDEHGAGAERQDEHARQQVGEE